MKKTRSDYDKITDLKRRYVMQGLRFQEPKASEIEKYINVLAEYHGDKTTGVVEAIKRESKRIQKMKK